MLGTLICAAALCAAPDDAELLETLRANWTSQRSAIATAHFRARAFRSGDVDPLTEDEVDAVFASVDLVANPDDLRKIVFALWKYKEYPTDPWSFVEVLAEGSRLRERMVNRPGDRDLNDNVVDQGVTVVGNDAANQTSILRTSDSRWVNRKIDDFRFLPGVGIGAHVASRESGRLHITDPDEPRDEFEVDEATGFAHSWRSYTDGSLSQEIFQFGPVSYPGDVLLPTVIAKLRFDRGKLAFADILVIEEAEVNVDLPQDAFVAKAPKGRLVVDARNPKEDNAFRPKSEIDDVVKAFPLVAGSTESSAAPISSTVVVSLVIIGGLLVVSLVFFYRRPKVR